MEQCLKTWSQSCAGTSPQVVASLMVPLLGHLGHSSSSTEMNSPSICIWLKWTRAPPASHHLFYQ